MSTTTTNVIQKVQEIASLAGYKVYEHDQLQNMLVCPFDMGGGRSQTVYLLPCGQTGDGHEVLCFMSPCMAIKKGLLNGVSKKQAVDLLKRNSQLLGGHFAIETFGDIDVLVVRTTQIVETMEVEEFQMHVNLVAVIADRYEQEQGTDIF